MSRWAPSITAVYALPDGAVDVQWDLDRFFNDPEEPDEIRVVTPHDSSPPLPPSQRSFTIRKEVVGLYAGGRLLGQVVFAWNGSPNEVLSTPFAIDVIGDAAGKGGAIDYRPGVPVLTLVARTAKSLRQENTITIGWSSSNLTHGRISWRASGHPNTHSHAFKPHGAKYSGQFTTGHPLVPRTSYEFRVRVENKFHATSSESVLVVTSHDNHRSVRDFLAASGVSTPTGLRAHLPGNSGLRAVMGA